MNITQITKSRYYILGQRRNLLKLEREISPSTIIRHKTTSSRNRIHRIIINLNKIRTKRRSIIKKTLKDKSIKRFTITQKPMNFIIMILVFSILNSIAKNTISRGRRKSSTYKLRIINRLLTKTLKKRNRKITGHMMHKLTTHARTIISMWNNGSKNHNIPMLRTGKLIN